MTVLITGGMGFIGLSTVEAFLKSGNEVIATYHNTWRLPSFLEPYMGKQLIFEQCDLDQPHALLALARKYKVDGIVHMAIHGRAYEHPGDDLRANMDKLSWLLDAARDAKVRRLTLASNSAPYINLAGGPYKEEDPLPMDSATAPAAFKKAWEILTLVYAKASGLDLVNLRLSNVYGPMYASMRNLPSRLVHAAVKGAEPDFSPAFGGVPYADDELGLSYVKDIARSVALVHNSPKLEHRLYNVSPGYASTNAEVLAAVKKAKPGFEAKLNEGRGPGYKPNNYGDITRISTELGYAPEYDLERAIAEYVAWLEAGNPQ